jgi:hypothetical protein
LGIAKGLISSSSFTIGLGFSVFLIIGGFIIIRGLLGLLITKGFISSSLGSSFYSIGFEIVYSISGLDFSGDLVSLSISLYSSEISSYGILLSTFSCLGVSCFGGIIYFTSGTGVGSII